jgi:vacuolar protein sorting-associated protein 13D
MKIVSVIEQINESYRLIFPLFIVDMPENKEFTSTSDTDYMQISIHVDAVSCLLTDDSISPIHISFQRFNCQIQNFLTIDKALKTLVVNGRLGSVSVRDLSPFGKLYDERFCTSGTNALTFNYSKEEDLVPILSSNFPSRLQLYLRMTSVQYIHTQRFLMDLIHFFDRFQHDQDCYNRIRSAAAGQMISCAAGRSTGIELDIEAESPILILPEYALNKPVIILHLGHIIVKNRFLIDNQPGTLTHLLNKSTNSTCLLDVIHVQFQDTLLYSATYCPLDTNIESTVRFSTFAFHRQVNERFSMLRERAYLNIQIERNLDSSLNHLSPTYSIKADLSSIDILLDTCQYALVRGILAYNIGEQLERPTRPAMIIDDPLCVSTVLTGDVYLDMIFIIQMDNVGFEIFIADESKHVSLGYCTFTKSNFAYEKYSNNNQVLDLTCSSIKLTDTRIDNTNQFREILTSSSSLATSTSQMQLEIHLLSTKTDDKFTIVLNHTRILFIVDWLLKLNDFLQSFQQISMINDATMSTLAMPTTKLFEIRLNINQSELVLVQTTNNEQSNALVLSGVLTLTYRESQPNRPLDCNLFNVTLFSCQMNDIRSTAVSIIEPINITFNIHLSKDKQQRIFELNLQKLFIRLSYSDMKLMLYMFQSINEQIDRAQSRDVIPKYTSRSLRKSSIFDNEIMTEYCPVDASLVDFRVRSAVASTLSEFNRQQSIDDIKEAPSTSTTFFHLDSIEFSCDQSSLCLIDDCLNANIPLLNLNLTRIKLNLVEYQTHRIQNIEFQLNIDYYNRLLSGYEPFIEQWPLQMTLKTSNCLTSLAICSNHVLNMNYTKTMHQLYDLVKNNWLEDYYNSNDRAKQMMSFRQPKPFEPYCFRNLVAQRVKFRTWLSSQQRYDQYDHVVQYNETKSFTFPSESSIKKLPNNKEQPSTSSYSDRRLSITIDGWECLQPISIDRVGTFFRLALPSSDRLQKPVLVFIDVAMTDSSMRSITIRSAIQIHNQLLTSIDVRLKCGSGSLHDLRLESNEIRSLPLQFCPTLRQFQVRPAEFMLNYCGEPINWIEIANEHRRRRPPDHDK